MEDEILGEVHVPGLARRPVHAHHDHDILEDRQTDLLKPRHGHIHSHCTRSLLTNIDNLFSDGVEGNNVHLRDVADVLCRISHGEFEVETDKGIEEVKLAAVEVRVALQLELELEIVGSGGLVIDLVGISDASFFDLKPLAFRWNKLDGLLLEESPLVIRQRS